MHSELFFNGNISLQEYLQLMKTKYGSIRNENPLYIPNNKNINNNYKFKTNLHIQKPSKTLYLKTSNNQSIHSITPKAQKFISNNNSKNFIHNKNKTFFSNTTTPTDFYLKNTDYEKYKTFKTEKNEPRNLFTNSKNKKNNFLTNQLFFNNENNEHYLTTIDKNDNKDENLTEYSNHQYFHKKNMTENMKTESDYDNGFSIINTKFKDIKKHNKLSLEIQKNELLKIIQNVDEKKNRLKTKKNSVKCFYEKQKDKINYFFTCLKENLNELELNFLKSCELNENNAYTRYEDFEKSIEELCDEINEKYQKKENLNNILHKIHLVLENLNDEYLLLYRFSSLNQKNVDSITEQIKNKIKLTKIPTTILKSNMNTEESVLHSLRLTKKNEKFQSIDSKIKRWSSFC